MAVYPNWLGNTLGTLGSTPGGTPVAPTLNNMGRGRFLDALAAPGGRDRLFGYTRAEVGNQGPQAEQTFIETILNRAAARGQTLPQTLSGSFFPGITHQRAAQGVDPATRDRYDALLTSVLGGSNLAKGATGNASGTVGFAGGPQTVAYGGERFGIEGPDRGWMERLGLVPGANLAGTGFAPSTVGTSPQGVGYVNPAAVAKGATTNPAELERKDGGGFDIGRFLANFDFKPAQVKAAPVFQFGSPMAKFAQLGQRRA